MSPDVCGGPEGAGRRSRQQLAMRDITAMFLKRPVVAPARAETRPEAVQDRTGRHDNVIENTGQIFTLRLYLFNKDGFFISSKLYLLSSSCSPHAPHHHHRRGTAVATPIRRSGEDFTSDSTNCVSLGAGLAG